MKFGICLPNFGPLASRPTLVEGALAAETSGFDSIWLGDHLLAIKKIASRYPYSASGRFPVPTDGDWFELITTMSFLAGRTARVLLGASVLILPYRNALVAAKELATAAVLSEGRIVVGVGVGWMQEEFEALGVDFAQRGRLTDETIRVFRHLWGANVGAFRGDRYSFSQDVAIHPKPPAIPILIGGHSRAAYRRVVELGDGWLALGREPEEVGQDLTQIGTACEQLGRTPTSVRVYLSRGVVLEARPLPEAGRRALHGSPEQVRADIQRYAEAGVEHLVVFPYREGLGTDVQAMTRAIERVGAVLAGR